MSDDRDLTIDEKRWVSRLLKCLNAMPESIEISVLCSGVVNIMNAGELKKHFDEYGDADNPSTLTYIIPKTASRIDGRDSQI